MRSGVAGKKQMLGLKDRLEVVYETQVGNPGISTQEKKKKKGNSREDIARRPDNTKDSLRKHSPWSDLFFSLISSPN